MQPAALTAKFPKKLQFLFKPKRYKVAYGGRGSAKSWSIARALLILGAKKKLRILCAREVQNSISESVHKLLHLQIIALGLEKFYKVLDNSIRGVNGTEFFFEGIHRNIGKIRSIEGIDICWVEEAVNIPKASWETLIPTVRNDPPYGPFGTGSEIWVSFNPELNTDETYMRFVVDPPAECISQKVNFTDNPFFPKVLEAERIELQRKDKDAYLTVWEGHCRITVSGAIFAKQLRDATEKGRICKVPYDPRKPVHTAWDLGWKDLVSIWFIQKVGFEYHIIDYLEVSQTEVSEIVKSLNEKPYVYGTDFLPHDGGHETLAAKGLSIKAQLNAFDRRARVMPNTRVSTQISAARTVFPLCYFDEKLTFEGVEHLRRFKFMVDEETGERENNPYRHDIHSHGSSAFMTFALSTRTIDKKAAKAAEAEEKKKKKKEESDIYDFGDRYNNQAWMG